MLYHIIIIIVAKVLDNISESMLIINLARRMWARR